MNGNDNHKFSIGKALVAVLVFLGVVWVISVIINSANINGHKAGDMSESWLYDELVNHPKEVHRIVFQGGVAQVFTENSERDNSAPVSVNPSVGGPVASVPASSGPGYYEVNMPDESDRTIVRQAVMTANKNGSSIQMENSAVSDRPSFWSLVMTFLPIALLIGFFMMMMKSQQGGGMNAMAFGKSRAKQGPPKSDVRFKDVIGCDEAKEELSEIVEMLKNPSAARADGTEIPSGVLLEGAPGGGKTLLAMAAANEAGVSFFALSGSDFVEMFVGVGASRVRDTWAQAKAARKAIIFIDEIDAVGRKRGAGMGGGNDEREQTLNQILVEMDGYDNKHDDGTLIIVIAATNRADVLDPALLRPGRFTRRINVELPDVEGREKMFAYYFGKSKTLRLSESVSLKELAATTTGMSGADISNVVNESRIYRKRRMKSDDPRVSKEKEIIWDDIDKAISKQKYGPERKSLLMSESDKKKVTVHEGGHGTVAYELLGPDCVRKATIIPTGKAGGYFEWLYDGNKMFYSEEDCLNIIAISVAGRVSQLYFKEKGYLEGSQKDSGVASDYQQACSLARRMVAEWGMSDEVGIIYAPIHEQQFLGVGSDDTISESLRSQIETEAKKIIASCEERARKVIEKYADRMEVFFAELLEKETLNGAQIRAILGQPVAA